MIGRLRGLGLTIAEIRELCRARDCCPHQRCSYQAIGPHLAQLLHAAKQRIDDRISMLRQVRDRIEQFEARQRDALTGNPRADLFADDPRPADNTWTACS